MNKYFVLLISAFLFACQQNPTKEITTVTGTIINPSGNTVSFKKGDYSIESTLDEDGNFVAELIDIDEGCYTFSDGNESAKLYIIPGKDFSMSLDTKEFDESIKYEGEGVEGSNYMAEKYLFEEENPIDYKELYSSEESAFSAAVQNLMDKKMAFLKKYKLLPESFLDFAEKSIKYEKLSYLQNYKSAHRHFTNNEDFEPTDDLLVPLKDLSMTDEKDFVNISSYKQLVRAYFAADEIEDNIKKLPEIKSPVIMKDVLRILSFSMRPGSDDMETVYNALVEYSDDETFKSSLAEKYETYKLLVKGSDSPVFNYQNTDGEYVSLEDLKGKNVYIDVWATWCGPCIREIPALKALESEYHDEDIEFVSISIDEMKDKQKWIDMVADKDLKGVQLMADEAWDSKFVKDYGIQGIPRFILVDSEGKIMSADAPRPSADIKIKEMINTLVNKT